MEIGAACLLTYVSFYLEHDCCDCRIYVGEKQQQEQKDKEMLSIWEPKICGYKHQPSLLFSYMNLRILFSHSESHLLYL